MKSRINRDEREISISELWWYVISKWKWLVIGMVVGALLMGAFGAYSANNADAPKEITMEELTPAEQEEVKETSKKNSILKVSVIARRDLLIGMHGISVAGKSRHVDSAVVDHLHKGIELCLVGKQLCGVAVSLSGVTACAYLDRLDAQRLHVCDSLGKRHTAV